MIYKGNGMTLILKYGKLTINQLIMFTIVIHFHLLFTVKTALKRYLFVLQGFQDQIDGGLKEL